MLTWPFTPRRGAARSTKTKPFGEFDACIGGWELRGRAVHAWPPARSSTGGGRGCSAAAPTTGDAFPSASAPTTSAGKSRDGLGDDWPIGYNDLAPYYDQVDELIGIFGSVEGLPNHPDGNFLPPPKPRCYELLVKQACDNAKVTCIPSRLSIMTQPLHATVPPATTAASATAAARIDANFSSTNVLLPPALATGKLTLITNAMAREVTLGKDGLANGVTTSTRRPMSDKHVDARRSWCSPPAPANRRGSCSTRRSAHFPHGLANSSGVVGKYLTDTTGTDVAGSSRRSMTRHRTTRTASAAAHLYSPWWLDNAKLDFPRGYHIEIGRRARLRRATDSWAASSIIPACGGYGKQLKDDYRRYYGATIGFSGRGEMIPNADSPIASSIRQGWTSCGIPVLRFHWKWSDHE